MNPLSSGSAGANPLLSGAPNPLLSGGMGSSNPLLSAQHEYQDQQHTITDYNLYNNNSVTPENRDFISDPMANPFFLPPGENPENVAELFEVEFDELEEEDSACSAPLGHIYVEKGEKSLALFVRCTTRQHVTQQFQSLVDEMHNITLNWPFVESEMFFLDPGGLYPNKFIILIIIVVASNKHTTWGKKSKLTP